MALIYAIGDSSGAHFNPAVTFGFSLKGVFPWRRLPAYWVAQIAGSIFAALLLDALFGPIKNLGATTPHYGEAAAFVMEIALTTLLVSVILGTATRYSLVGPNAAIAVGGTIALCGFFGGPISGASMNPARSLGPALVSGHLTHAWIYLIAPLMGSLTATTIIAILCVKDDPNEPEVAQGKAGKDQA
jgi:aquaporin Z